MPERPMHLERYRGEGDRTCCGRRAVDQGLDILDEEQASIFIPADGDICKSCIKTERGKISLSEYRQAERFQEV